MKTFCTEIIIQLLQVYKVKSKKFLLVDNLFRLPFIIIIFSTKKNHQFF